ncbi:MAG: DUF1993 domain-containing protein [Rhodocyclales bacterium]|nr:DUF1993 domain-containing protein [Rhodocyclales bacterium]
MAISMYSASIPALRRGLTSLAAILAKAEEHARTRKIDPTVLLGARLYPDMLPLIKQVHIASDNAKGCAARLAGREVPKYEDNETSFAELAARIAKTIAFLDTFDPQQIDGSEERDVSLQAGGQTHEFKGLPYLTGWVLPNFYFHVATAYAILRHNGVELAKKDFLG